MNLNYEICSVELAIVSRLSSLASDSKGNASKFLFQAYPSLFTLCLQGYLEENLLPKFPLLIKEQETTGIPSVSEVSREIEILTLTKHRMNRSFTL